MPEEEARALNQKLKELPDDERIKLVELIFDGICKECCSLVDGACWGCYDSHGDYN